MDSRNNQLSIVGVPFSGGQPRGGVDLGPGVLRKAGIAAVVEQLDWKVVHDEDVVIVPKIASTINLLKNPHWVGAVCKDVYDRVYERVKDGDFCLTLGGDQVLQQDQLPLFLKTNLVLVLFGSTLMQI